MKEVWVRIQPWRKELATAAIEQGADAVVLNSGDSARIKKLGVIATVAEDGDFLPGQDVVEVDLQSAQDQETIIGLDPEKKVIIRARDWSVIPLENVLAQKNKNVLAEVGGVDEARVFLGVLERGVDGVVINTTDMAELARIMALVKSPAEKIELTPALVTEVTTVGMGDRVCVDTCSLLGPAQGLLVGNSSRAMFLVHPENIETPYVDPRPFRVNAGPVHAYTRLPGGRTCYLCELDAGDEVLAVSPDGTTQMVVVGRIKIERRPLILVRAETGGRALSLLLQNAETVRLTTPVGEPLSVVDLEAGSRVLVVLDEGGRHFGHAVDETLSEK